MTSPQKTQIVKQIIAKYGFEAIGISASGFLENEAKQLENWLNNGYHGTMKWMENHFDKRTNTKLLVEGSKSVISMLFNYYPAEFQPIDAPKISKYAYGQDYHDVIKDKLKLIIEELEQHFGSFQSRFFVDSAPVLERAWAAKSGLGWIGKHSLLITKKRGSFYFIAQIICDLELDYDSPTTDHCGSCTKCIDACPTEAIVADKVIDSNKCISYLTIELKDKIPTEFKKSMQDWAFGCDICQDVCPWNRFSIPHSEVKLTPNPTILTYKREDWNKINEDIFRDIFRKSAVKRTKFSGFLRNLQFLEQSEND
ncbi:MAG: tRNA epoxyqueuosine(34) reductase QueG [Flavobacteriales bacterium]|nr:tRNA epoxyqueuosine(34) reductase QueG [Flavobacteriales bacterium]